MNNSFHGIVDIHHHLVYGLDDGSQSMEQTIQMLERAYRNGVGYIIATPHAEPGRKPFYMDIYLERLDEIRAWCAEAGIPIQIFSGSEILYTPETVNMLRMRRIPTLAETEYVLVEFTPQAPYKLLVQAATKLRKAGYRPIFAHIERYRCLRAAWRVHNLRRNYGVRMQMNAATICEKHGWLSQLWIDYVIEKGWIDYAASDAHNVSSRPCMMKLCYKTLKARFGKRIARRLCIAKPRRIIQE